MKRVRIIGVFLIMVMLLLVACASKPTTAPAAAPAKAAWEVEWEKRRCRQPKVRVS